MENFLSLLESADTSWLTPSFITWAMDMSFAFMCGLGLFYLLLPLLPLNSPSPPPAQNTSAQKVVKRERSKVRKKTRTMRAYRGSRKKPKKDKVLVSLLHSTLGRLVDTISFCQILRQDASDEMYEPEATNNTHLPPRQQVEESAVSDLSSVSSSAPLKEKLLPKGSKALSHVLLYSSSTSIESQSSVAASQPPETLTPGRPRSPQWAPSSPSHPPDPVGYPPSVPDPSTGVRQCVCKALGTSQSTPLPDESSQRLETISSKHPEVFQLHRDACKGHTNCLGRTEKDPEGPLGKALQAVSETEVETGRMSHPRSDSQSVSPVGPEKKQLEDTLKNYSNSKWRHTKDSKVPVGICQGIPMKHALAPPENSKILKTWEKSSLNEATICKKTSHELSFLDIGTQKVLETHLTRRLVRHRWNLPLRGLKTIHVFSVYKATASPFPQPSNAFLSSWDSTNNCKMASDMEEPFQTDPEEKEMKITTSVESLSTQIPPPALQLKFLRETPPSEWASGPSEATTTVQEEDRTSMSTPESLVGRDWHSDTSFRSWKGNPEPNPVLVKGVYESQDSEGVSFRKIYRGVSVREISVASQSPRSRDTRDLEEAEDWSLTTETEEMAKSLTNNESLETNESPSHSRPISQDSEDSVLSTPNCLAPGVLQDCGIGTLLQDCAPEVLLAADILAYRASQSSFKTFSSSSKSTSQDSYPFSARKRSISKTSVPQEPWTSYIFGPNNQKEVYRSPSQEVQFSGMSSIQACGHEKKFGDRIKDFILSVLTPKGKGQENSPQKAKALSSTTQSQESVMNRVVMPRQEAETQDLMTSVRWILEEKLGLHQRFAPSKRDVQADSPQAPVSMHVCHHRIPPEESNIEQGHTDCVHQANPMVHSQPSTDKWMPYADNRAQVFGEPVSQAIPYQHRTQAPLVPGTRLHCPRHCRCTSVPLSGK